MDIRKLQRAIVDGLEDVKAQNIAVFNTEHLSPLFERVIIASGTSNRQTKALASSVRETVKSRGMDVLRTEGEDNGEWIIVDCGAAVVHLMQPAIRDYYHLEEIWGGKRVAMKLGEVSTKLVKASEPEPAPRPGAGRKAAPAPRFDMGKAPGKSAGKAPAAKSAARRPAAKKTVQGAATSKLVVGKPPARKAAPARKTVARKAPARKTARPG
jgi:ribosome-associated protein